MSRISSALGLAFLASGCASQGSLHKQFAAQAKDAFAAQPLPPEQVLSAQDVAHLPATIQRYLAFVGALGKPRVHNARLQFAAEMFRKPGASPMPATSEQFNFFGRPTRLFYMDARMFGLPTVAFHSYREAQASMVVRVASLYNVVDISGAQLGQAETVTVLNDMTVFAPAALVDPRVSFEERDATSTTVHFKSGTQDVSALLRFGAEGELVDFISDDRSALQDDGSLKRTRWSTPLKDYREFQGRKVPTYGEAVYHLAEGPFVYGRFTLRNVEYNVVGMQER